MKKILANFVMCLEQLAQANILSNFMDATGWKSVLHGPKFDYFSQDAILSKT
jgi:hypothetical protein